MVRDRVQEKKDKEKAKLEKLDPGPKDLSPSGMIILAPGSTEGSYYLVEKRKEGWTCSCPDHRHRGKRCKHMDQCGCLNG